MMEHEYPVTADVTFPIGESGVVVNMYVPPYPSKTFVEPLMINTAGQVFRQYIRHNTPKLWNEIDGAIAGATLCWRDPQSWEWAWLDYVE